ncbi:hypothetical protein ACFFH9_03530 [Chromohalobacter japonicus]|uniref:hypothetical protein n=1 Tax=Chromohalobacter japonicus TaxID=223900 RepID=UPI001FF4563D|nr:hypothetical protein [Chromohalobacter japonicus]MCK0753562.1 hypothetical protein [Chromohalobacter japonicus]
MNGDRNQHSSNHKDRNTDANWHALVLGHTAAGRTATLMMAKDPDARRNTVAVGPSSIGKRTSDKGDWD